MLDFIFLLNYDKILLKDGDNINTDRMINILLLQLSNEHNIFYMERRTYKENKVQKFLIVNIDGNNYYFNSKKDILLELSKWK